MHYRIIPRYITDLNYYGLPFKDRSDKHTITTYHKLLPQKMTLAYLNKLQLPEDENIYHPTNPNNKTTAHFFLISHWCNQFNIITSIDKYL